jgi:hypothetical protein
MYEVSRPGFEIALAFGHPGGNPSHSGKPAHPMLRCGSHFAALCKYKLQYSFLLCSVSSIFVKISAMLVSVGSHLTLIQFAAAPSQTAWKHIALCFLFNLALTFEALLTTLSLSPSIFVGPSIGIPNILNLYLSALIRSVANLIATNSDPNVDDSHMFCFFENQSIGALFKLKNRVLARVQPTFAMASAPG